MMKPLRAIFILALAGALFAPCCQQRDDVDHQYDPWLVHKPTAWVTTPGGHVRDAGPFASVAQSFIKDSDIDAATDAAYLRFQSLYPEFPAVDVPFSINDDYVMWVSVYKSHTPGAWAAGICWPPFPIEPKIGLTLFSRGQSNTDPSPQFIVREPSANYSYWRYTTTPLLPGLEHEMLHFFIGDPGHISPLWQRLSTNPRKAAAISPAPGIEIGIAP